MFALVITEGPILAVVVRIPAIRNMTGMFWKDRLWKMQKNAELPLINDAFQ